MARPPVKKIVLVALAGAAVMAVFLVAGVVSRRLFESPDSSTPTRPAGARSLVPPVDEQRFRVTGIQGPVECEQDGRRYVLQAGDLLALQDIIRTPSGSRVILKRGQTEIELRESLELRLEELADQTARFGILRGDGDISASIGGKDEGLTINAEDTRTVSQGPARWIVSLTKAGKVSVAVSQGQVKFRSQKQEITVPEGFQTAADRGQPPIPPEPLSEDILLSVIWPEPAPGDATATVKGKTNPTARVKVNRVPVDVAADGSFASPVPIRAGQNPIEVESQDPLGHSKSVRATVQPPATSPSLKAIEEDLWKQ